MPAVKGAHLYVKLEGLDELQAALRNTPKVARKLLYKALREAAEAVRDDARQHVQVKTGALRDHIQTAGRGLSWRAGVAEGSVNARGASAYPHVYARWVEYGTAKTGAKPFMKPAAEAESGRLIGRLRGLSMRIVSDVAAAQSGPGRDSRGRFT